LEDAADILLKEHFPKIIDQEKFDILGRPNISVTKLALNNPFEFKATFAVLPEFELPDYKKIAASVTKPASAKASAGEAVVTPSVAKPVEKPVVAPANTAAEKPVKKAVAPSVTTEKLSIPASTPDIERGWMFYKQAVGRGISDSERIELLQSIIDKFGSSSAEQVNKEISKIKKRMQ
jgi:hypothetical protein